MSMTAAMAYATLKVPMGIGFEEVRAAYKRLLLTVHPDKGGDPEEFRRVRKAWELLAARRFAKAGPSKLGGPGKPVRPPGQAAAAKARQQEVKETEAGDAGRPIRRVKLKNLRLSSVFCSQGEDKDMAAPRVSLKSKQLRQEPGRLVTLASWEQAVRSAANRAEVIKRRRQGLNPQPAPEAPPPPPVRPPPVDEPQKPVSAWPSAEVMKGPTAAPAATAVPSESPAGGGSAEEFLPAASPPAPQALKRLPSYAACPVGPPRSFGPSCSPVQAPAPEPPVAPPPLEKPKLKRPEPVHPDQKAAAKATKRPAPPSGASAQPAKARGKPPSAASQKNGGSGARPRGLTEAEIQALAASLRLLTSEQRRARMASLPPTTLEALKKHLLAQGASAQGAKPH